MNMRRLRPVQKKRVLHVGGLNGLFLSVRFGTAFAGGHVALAFEPVSGIVEVG